MGKLVISIEQLRRITSTGELGHVVRIDLEDDNPVLGEVGRTFFQYNKRQVAIVTPVASDRSSLLIYREEDAPQIEGLYFRTR